MSRFDKEAKTWDSSRRFRVAKAFSDFIKKSVPLNKKMKLLDYGCGTGLVAYQFEDEVYSITGMDSSQKMLQEFLSKKNSDNVEAILHDITKNSLERESFDIIVSSMTLHHIKEPNRFFNEANNALSDGGYLAVGDLITEDGNFHDKGNDGVHHFGFSKDEIISYFENSGFKLIDYNITFRIEKKSRIYEIFGAIGKK